MHVLQPSSCAPGAPMWSDALLAFTPLLPTLLSLEKVSPHQVSFSIAQGLVCIKTPARALSLTPMLATPPSHPAPRKACLCTHHTHHMSSGIGSAPHAAVHPAYALQPRTCDSPADVLSAAVIERRLCRRHCSRLQHLRTRRRRSGSRLARPRTHWC